MTIQAKQQQQLIKEIELKRIILDNERKELTDILNDFDTFQDLIKAKFSDGSNALHLIVKMAEEIKAHSSTNNRNEQNSYLYEPSYSSSAIVFEILRRGGMDVNAKDESGKTPLHYACESGSTKQWSLIEILLDFGAKVNISDQNGNTPLHLIAKTKNLQSFALVLSHCKAVEATNSANPLNNKKKNTTSELKKRDSNSSNVFNMRNRKGQTFFQLIKDPLMLKLFKRFSELEEDGKGSKCKFFSLSRNNLRSRSKDFEKLIQNIIFDRSIFHENLLNLLISLIILNDCSSVENLLKSTSLTFKNNKNIANKIFFQELQNPENYPSTLPTTQMEKLVNRFIKFKEIPGRMIYFKCKHDNSSTGKSINFSSASYKFEHCQNILEALILTKNPKLEKEILAIIDLHNHDGEKESNKNDTKDMDIWNVACEIGSWNIISHLFENKYDFDDKMTTSLIHRYHPNLLEKFKQTISDEDKPITCPICREDYKPGKIKNSSQAIEWTQLKPCNHKYHSDCLKMWLCFNQRCPYCRGQIMEKQVFTRAD